MMKFSLKGKDILQGIRNNQSNLNSHIPDYDKELQLCFDKDSNLSLVDLDRLFKKYLLDMEEIICSDCSFTRYLGFLLLLYRGDTTEQLWSAFEDPCVHIRMLIINNFSSSNRHKLFNEIFKYFTKDPRIIIRRSALTRIREDFSDLFSYRIENLPSRDQRNILPLLNASNSHDRKILKSFIWSESNDISSLAVYYLQKGQPEQGLSLFEKASSFYMLRNASLHHYAQKTNPHFLEAFGFVSTSAPLDIQDEFLHELCQLPPKEEYKSSYCHAMDLIKYRSDPFCSQRLEEYVNNDKLNQLLGSVIAKGFSKTNQYQTFHLLISLLKKEKDGPMKNKLMKKASSFKIPLPEGMVN